MAAADPLVTVARAQRDVSLAALDIDYLEELIQAASAAVVRFCRREFVLKERVEVYDGDGTDVLILDQLAVTMLTSVVVIDGNDVEYVVAGSNFRVKAVSGIIKFKANAVTNFTWFPVGFQNVRVTYTAGFDPMEPDIQEAVVQAIAAYLSDHASDDTVKSEKIGDYAYTKFNTSATGADFPLPSRAKALLTSYKDRRV